MAHQTGLRNQLDKEEGIVKQVEALFEKILCVPPPTNVLDLWKEHLEIRAKLEKIAGMQASLGPGIQAPTTKRDSEGLKAFSQWCDLIGIRKHNVDVVMNDQIGLELVATSDIPKATKVVEVPRHAMLSLELCRKSAMLKKAFEKDPLVQGMGNVGLALFLCGQHINGAESKWFPYISVLPSTFTTPMFYDPDQLLQLKPSPLFEEAILFYRTIARQFSYFLVNVSKNGFYDHMKKNKKNDPPIDVPIFYNSPFSVSNFTFSLYMWAVGVVTTRVNMIPKDESSVNEPDMIPALIPVLDMANHDFVTLTTDDSVSFSAEDQRATLLTAIEIKKGSPVTMFYGRRSNGDHLLHNGFVPFGDNLYDRFKLKLGIPKNDKAYEAKTQLISKFASHTFAQVNVFHFDLIYHDEFPFSKDLEKFATIFVCENPTDEARESKEMSMKGLEFLRTRLTLLEKAYGTGELNADLVGIPGDIARLKVSEKKILQNSREFCEKLLSSSS